MCSVLDWMESVLPFSWSWVIGYCGVQGAWLALGVGGLGEVSL